MAEWKNGKGLGVFDGIIWLETPTSIFNIRKSTAFVVEAAISEIF